MKQKSSTSGYLIVAAAIIIGINVLANAYLYKYEVQETITVTGLGETEFTSDLIVWSGAIEVETSSVERGYEELERNKSIVNEFILSKGIAAETTTFDFVRVDKQFESAYTASGNYMGQRFVNYKLVQPITIESTDVESVEALSREISSLIAKGITLEAYSPKYYYTKLEDVKLSLIESASADARERALKIAAASGSKVGRVQTARMGVFQITGSNSNDEYQAGGSFNTSNRDKKATITMRIEYRIK